MLVELSIALGLILMLVGSVSIVVFMQVFFFQTLLDYDVYTKTLPLENSVYQRVTSTASAFEIYPNRGMAITRVAQSSSGSAVRLQYPDGRAALIYYDPALKQLLYENLTPTLSRWVMSGDVDSANFTIGDPSNPTTAGVLALQYNKQGKQLTFYGQPF